MHSEDTYAIAQRTHKQQTTQQVTTVTKVVREVKHLGSSTDPSDSYGQPIDYVMGVYQPHNQYVNYNHIDAGSAMFIGDPSAVQYHHQHYQDYEQYPSVTQLVTFIFLLFKIYIIFFLILF